MLISQLSHRWPLAEAEQLNISVSEVIFYSQRVIIEFLCQSELIVALTFGGGHTSGKVRSGMCTDRKEEARGTENNLGG